VSCGGLEETPVLCFAPLHSAGLRRTRGLAGHIEAIGKDAALFFPVILVVVGSQSIKRATSA
jgi:hypothetical protein